MLDRCLRSPSDLTEVREPRLVFKLVPLSLALALRTFTACGKLHPFPTKDEIIFLQKLRNYKEAKKFLNGI